jgi:hypothetical protein
MDDIGEEVSEVQPVVWLETALNGLLICGGITYITFGIVFMVRDQANCGGYSKFWVFCCAQMVSAVISYIISWGIYIKDKTAPDGVGRMNYINLAVYIIIEVPLIIWGFLDLYVDDSRCNAEKHLATQLYIWAEVSVWVRFVYFIAIITGSIVAISRKPIPKELDESC